MKLPILAAMVLFIATPLAAQTYHPLETFAPRPMSQPVNTYRSSDGLPGPGYWQNRADYDIHARLDEKGPLLSGSEIITYTNNSPDRLDIVWLQLDQNRYRPDSRGDHAGGRYSADHSDGYGLDSVEVLSGKTWRKAATLVDDTRLRITLPGALKAAGGQIRIRIVWHFTIPGEWGGRMAWGMAKAGPIYDLAQWYPRMAVYDDIRGWDPLPYMAQEFYLEYGDFDYYVDAPSDMLVAGSGELMNPGDVLTPTEQARFAKARLSDATVTIRSPAETLDPATRPRGKNRLIWHYHMNDTRDVAFSASKVFAWDAARINLPGGKTSLAESFYPAESQGPGNWGRSTEYMKDAVEDYSRRWYPYPWPAALNIAGPATGMEYPGIVFDGVDDAGKVLFWISAHEIGHGWFPMIVGFDERRDAWMDEGFNTFIDTYESDDFHHGEYGPKRDSEYAPRGGNPVDEILPVIEDPNAPPILSRADTVIEKYRHPITYFKSALGLRLLREEILGPERFDPAFRRFIAAWAFKHPKPDDFFRAMASESGEDLDYWWRGWYDNNWTLDYAVESIGPIVADSHSQDPAPRGTAIVVGAHDRLIMPATLRVDFSDGAHQDIRLEADSFIRNPTTMVFIAGDRTVTAATIDPDSHLPDKDRSNNSLKANP